MALVPSAPRARPRAPPAGRRAPVRRRRRAALVAPARRAAASAPGSPTTSSGCPTPSHRYVAVTGDAGVLDETVAVPRRAAAASRTRTTCTSSRTRSTETRLAVRPLRARRSTASLAVGAHGLPLMGSGDWNDGMNRVGAAGQGRERLARLVPESTLDRVRADRRGARRPGRARTAGARTCAALRRGARSARLGRRLVSARLLRRRHAARLGRERRVPDRLASPQSWARALRRRPIRARHARRWRAVDEHLVRRGDGLVLLFTPPFDRSAARPGLHQGLPARASARTAASTRTRAIWSVLAFAALGRRRRGRRAVRPAEPDQPCQHAAPASHATRSSPTSWPPTSTASRRTSAAAAGPGTPARRAGCTGPALEWILGFRLRGTTLVIDPCIPRAWPGFEIDFRYHSSRYEIVVENPHGVSRGVASAELDGPHERRWRRPSHSPTMGSPTTCGVVLG